MHLEISTEDLDLLSRIVNSALTEIRVELRRTSTRPYHDQLEREQTQLKRLAHDLLEDGGRDTAVAH